MQSLMRPLVSGLLALVMAFTFLTISPQQAEARHKRWIAAGVAAAVVGGVILSHRYHRRHRYYSSYDDYDYGYGYGYGYEPSYSYYPRYRYYRPYRVHNFYGNYYRPRWRHHRVHRIGYRHGGWSRRYGWR